ncbi:Decaprenylphosphoryl-2-keto-beta-D-erythro-pentose reductase [Pontiella desulfatans]|uniref:Decaprenylphosphoryl-2-keto-beta-D-erythro-pentos e reductase n=1 Tax=Pontiella desulfatans TaxID=2750659 RepID=A0A6C2U029_PONDE|nr:SDR family oxidoreductase [Pontiella desulfatans]VGO12951.1 Decaprenylphosphoryl-2-keto-beta-D-erythro-pentose reductase [Pontiella desulfatans]
MKNVLILGATSDMAQAIAKKYAAEGWSLTLAALEKELLEPIASDLRVRAGTEIQTLEFNATDYSSHRKLYESLETKPDAVIACFGYMSDQVEVRADIEDIRRTIDINFTGMATMLGVVANDFEKRGSGSIAAISSVAGDRGRQSNYIYGSAKAGLTAYLSGLRNRLAKKGVHVMTVKPGFCRTKMTENLELPAALTASPEQVADAVYNGMRKGHNTVYTLWMWRYIMLIIRHIPEFIFKKMGM